MWMYPIAIACGNTFILKPSERDPSAPMLAWQLLMEAGLPEGVMNVVRGAKNHMTSMPDADMEQAADALMGAGFGSAGERCMAVSVAVPVGDRTADILVEKLKPRVEALRIGPSPGKDA